MKKKLFYIGLLLCQLTYAQLYKKVKFSCYRIELATHRIRGQNDSTKSSQLMTKQFDVTFEAPRFLPINRWKTKLQHISKT
jgi:phosphatidate phosphatase PAH1